MPPGRVEAQKWRLVVQRLTHRHCRDIKRLTHTLPALECTDHNLIHCAAISYVALNCFPVCSPTTMHWPSSLLVVLLEFTFTAVHYCQLCTMSHTAQQICKLDALTTDIPTISTTVPSFYISFAQRNIHCCVPALHYILKCTDMLLRCSTLHGTSQWS